jgi:membrane-bound inhibitor of C-type lysozyme
LILILGLFLCSFLGGNCGKESFTSSTTSTNLVTGTTYTDSNGNSITVVSGNNGVQNLQLVQVGQSTPIVLSLTPPTGITAVANTYYAQPPHNVTAVVSTGSNGQISIQVNLPQGKTITLTQTSSTSSSGSSSSIFSSWTSSSSPSTSSSAIQLQTGTVFIDPSGNNITVFVNSDGSQSLQLVQISQPNYPTILTLTPPSGTTATVNTYYAQPPSLMTATVITDSNGQTAIQINLAGGQTIVFSQQGSAAVSTQSNNSGITSTQYYGSTGSPYQTGASAMSYNGAYGGSAGSATGPYGNTAYYAQGPYGNTAAGTSSPNSSQYYSSLPPGIPASQIPSGQEDLYILKSQVVPPVCPVCPASNSSSSNDPDSAPKCQPCPPCGRCPEPSFECKKVPNYNAINNSYLPQPIINDFSSFGM